MIVYRYPIRSESSLVPGLTTLAIPAGARLLHVDIQDGRFCLWAEVPDKDAPTEARQVQILGTGWDLPFDPAGEARYINTVLTEGGAYVWHAYEMVPIPAAPPLLTLTLDEYEPGVEYPEGTVYPVGWEAKWDAWLADPSKHEPDHVQVQGGGGRIGIDRPGPGHVMIEGNRFGKPPDPAMLALIQKAACFPEGKLVVATDDYPPRRDWLDRDDLTEDEIRERMRAEGWEALPEPPETV